MSRLRGPLRIEGWERPNMRQILLIGVVWLAGAMPAAAQTNERLSIAAVVRADRVSFEGGQNARLPVTGVTIGYRIWSHVLIEGEVTAASGEARRSYEGDFISFAGPGGTREEFLRTAIIARRTTINKAGAGFATAVAVETHNPGRVNLALRAGVSLRQYEYVEDTTVLRVPEGVTFEQAEAAMPDARRQRARSGLLAGASVPVRMTRRFHVAPEVRWVWGGPARIGNNYDEASFGARAVWKF
jgi:hypothetical protein